MRGFIHDKLPNLTEDEQTALDRRRDEIAEYIGSAGNSIDAQRIHAIDLPLPNINTGIDMWAKIVQEEIADGTLENVASALEEITPSLTFLRQRVDDIRVARQYLLDSTIPECKDLHAIVDLGFPNLEAYLETVTYIREIIGRVKAEPAAASMRADSEVHRRLSDAIKLSEEQFKEIAKTGIKIKGNAAYLGYRKYLDNNRLEAQRNEPVNREILIGHQAA